MKLARQEGSLPEIFFSVQGEGYSLGRPSVFVRLSLCNLHCVWCDTDYTWNWQGTSFAHQRDVEPGYAKYHKSDEIVEWSTEEVVHAIRQFDCSNIIFTGGEPLLHQDDLVLLAMQLRDVDAAYEFDIETNGTLIPNAELDCRITHYNVSPKLANSANRANLAIRPDAMTWFARCDRATFKFVVCEPTDVAEVCELSQRFEIPRTRIYLMPEGTTSDELRERSQWVIDECRREHFHFSDRLHVHLRGNRRGV